MTNTEIKKELQKMIKNNGWNKCYGEYGLNLSAGAKQMEKGNATIGFGYIEDDRYNAEEAYNKFVNSTEFKETVEKINGWWEREEKTDCGWTIVYIRLHF